MKWLPLVASAVLFGTGPGCQTPRSAVADANYPPSADPARPVRMQKPDAAAKESPVRQTVFQAVPASFPTPKDCEEAVRVCAHVNGVPILQEEVQQLIFPAMAGLSPQMSDAERKTQQEKLFQEGLQQIIDREVILQDLHLRLSKASQKQYLDRLKAYAGKEFDKTVKQMKARAGVKTDEEFKTLLSAQGQSLEGMRRQFERNVMAREYLKGMIFPHVERWAGHQEVVEYYREHPAEFQQQDGVKWQDIFIDSARYHSRQEARAVADQLVNRARKGEDFAQLLKYDNGDSSYRGGEGLGQHCGEIRPAEAEPALFAMKDGEVRVVELPTGFHVVRLVKRDHAGAVPLDDKTQDAVRKKLQMQVVERETKRFVEELKQKATIEVDAAP
jgi:hypothetical protein